jgi:hypothetical protein
MKIPDRLKATIPYLLFSLLCFSGLIVGLVTLTYCDKTLGLNFKISAILEAGVITIWIVPPSLAYWCWKHIREIPAKAD